MMTNMEQNTAVTVHLKHVYVQVMSKTSALPTSKGVQKLSNTSESAVVIELERAVRFLSIYYTLTLIVVGSVCNLLSIAVLSRKTFRGTSMSVYLRFLSVMDLGTILTGLMHFYLVSSHGGEQQQRNKLSCRLNNWFMNVFLYSSSWTLVSVTIERVLSILKPHHVRILCSPTKVVYVLIAIVLCMGAINSPIFLIFGNMEIVHPVTNETFTRSCVIVADRAAMSLVFWWMDGMVSAFVPSFILMVSNVIIVKGVVNSRKNIEKVISKSTTTGGPFSSDQADTKERKKKSGSTKKESSLTVTLLVINLTFVICNFPICAFTLGPHYQTEEGLGRLGDALHVLLLMLMYTNNALNFWLYFITGSKFRNELLSLVKEIFSKLTKR